MFAIRQESLKKHLKRSLHSGITSISSNKKNLGRTVEMSKSFRRWLKKSTLNWLHWRERKRVLYAWGLSQNTYLHSNVSFAIQGSQRLAKSRSIALITVSAVENVFSNTLWVRLMVKWSFMISNASVESQTYTMTKLKISWPKSNMIIFSSFCWLT